MADKWLVDPPREGAFALAKALADIEQARMGRKALARCPPAGRGLDTAKAHRVRQLQPRHPGARCRACWCTLAGYQCTAAGMVNMFPHTAHVESMAVFERV
jgi:23S rRNA (uracil1939-C5)-methyltransferase